MLTKLAHETSSPQSKSQHCITNQQTSSRNWLLRPQAPSLSESRQEWANRGDPCRVQNKNLKPHAPITITFHRAAKTQGGTFSSKIYNFSFKSLTHFSLNPSV